MSTVVWLRLTLPLIWMCAPRLVSWVVRMVNLVWKLTFDPRVPLPLRLLVPAALVYFVIPIGILPDFVPYVGFLDDLLVLGLAVLILVSFAPRDVVLRYAPWMARGKGEGPGEMGSSRVVEGSYHLVDEEESTPNRRQ